MAARASNARPGGRPRRALAAGAFAALTACGPSAPVPEIEFGGSAGVEVRVFPEKPAYPDQLRHVQPSVFAEPEFAWESDDRDDQVMFTPYLRVDGQDQDRTHADVREAYWRHTEDDWSVLIGVTRVFFGVTESRHLVNVINQVDAVEDIDEEDYLGQPMLQAERQTDVGLFSLFLMPAFRERTFPGRHGRLRTPPPVDDDAVYDSGLGRWRPSAALRYAHAVGDFDVGLHVFHGTGREPDLDLAADRRGLIPTYQTITQAGADVQYTTDAWLWKFEGLVRGGQGDRFLATVAGFEYTLFQVADTDADLGLLAEGLYDGRDDETFPTVFEHDVFTGFRLTLNDVQDTSLLAGLVTDVEGGPQTVRVEVGRRLGDAFRLELEGQAFFEGDSRNPLFIFEQDSFVALRLSRFF